MAMTHDRPPRIVAMLNQKGGVGKTTTTANLGHALAVAGLRVCLIDLDPQGHLTLHLGIEADEVERTVYDLLVDPACTADDCVIRGARPGLDVILAEVDLAAAEQEIAGRADRQSILRDKFAAIASDYDIVLIDCPPSLGLLTVNALTMADELIVPMQAHFLALQGVGRLLETVRLVCSSVNPQLRVSGVILCMYERQTTLAKEILADLEEFFESHRDSDDPWSECQVLRPPIRRNIKLAEAPSFGNTIFDYAPWCPGALDYRRLAAELMRGWGKAVAGFDVRDDEEDGAPGDASAATETRDDARRSVSPAERSVRSVAPPEDPEPPTIETHLSSGTGTSMGTGAADAADTADAGPTDRATDRPSEHAAERPTDHPGATPVRPTDAAHGA